MAKYSGGCEHVHTTSDKDPIDNHTCHCSVCKRVTGQATTHVAFFNHGDLKVDNMAGLKRQPFNDQNREGPARALHVREVRQADHARRQAEAHSRHRAELDGSRENSERDLSRVLRREDGRVKKPSDGRPVHEGLRPDFVWPKGVPA